MTIVQLIILYVISDTRLSSQHFIPPLQNCIAAEMCNHTWVPICGFDKTSTKTRSFPDECDMKEYNCDYKTDYEQTDQEKCKNNTNTDDVNKNIDVTSIITAPGRRLNVDSVINYPDYVSSTVPYDNDKNTDDESYLEDVYRNTDSSKLPDNILRRTRLINIKTILSPENFTYLTKPYIDVNEPYNDSSDIVSTKKLPTLTLTDTELADSKTAKSIFTEPLRHGPQCTCGQHTSSALSITTPITEVVTTATESITVSMDKSCTRHKVTSALTTISSTKQRNTTEPTSTSQVTATVELSTEANTVTEPVTNASITDHVSHSLDDYGVCHCGQHKTLPVTTFKQSNDTSVPDSITTSVISNTTLALKTTETETNQTITEHASHSFDADGKCNCGKYSSPITNTTTLITPKTTSEVTTTITNPVNQTGGECTCYMNTTPVMTTSSTTTEETITLSTTTPTVTTTSPMTKTTIKATTITPGSNCTCMLQTYSVTSTLLTTKASTTSTTEQVTAPVRECTCYMDTAKVTTPGSTTTSITSTESSTTETTTEDITNNEIDNTTTEIIRKSSKLHVTCSAYPKECKRPSTWETTSKAETRDFFRILKERYGNRVKMLRATTHWPLRIPKIQRLRDSFMYGRHNEG